VRISYLTRMKRPGRAKKGESGRTHQEKTVLFERRVRAGQLQAQKRSLRDIASILKCSLTTVHKDIRWIRNYWKEQIGLTYDEHIADVLREVDTAIKEAYAAWTRSIGQHVVTTERVSHKGGETTVRTETMAGDPRYLLVVSQLLDKKLRLFGTAADRNHGGKGLFAFVQAWVALQETDQDTYQLSAEERAVVGETPQLTEYEVLDNAE